VKVTHFLLRGIIIGCCLCFSFFIVLTMYLINIFYITDMLPQHQVNIRKLISECLNKKYDFSKEQCSSLKMILGTKHVGAILNVLM